MKKLSLREILEVPQFSFFIDPANFPNFSMKKQDGVALQMEANMLNQEKMLEMINSEETTQGDLEFARTDNFYTKSAATVERTTLENNEKKINVNSLILQLAFMSKYFLSQIEKSEKGDRKVNAELAFANGDIVSIRNGNIAISSLEEKPRDISKIKSDLAECILLANQQLLYQRNTKMTLGISGRYHECGIAQNKIIMNYSIKDLMQDSKSPLVLKALSKDKISELMEERLIPMGGLLKALSAGTIDKNIAIQLMLEGKINQDEVVNRIFKKSNIQGVALDESTSFESKLLLYSTGKISIDVLERGAQKYQEENLDLTDVLGKMSAFFDGNINKISELLTHHVLDYTNSMKFLQILQNNEQISEQDRTYLEKVMSDFKIDELVNNTENGELVNSTSSNVASVGYVPRLTIDPDRRLGYLKSIGAVKKLKIRGETLVKDSEENEGKKNSLDGYEIFIIPDKKIAVLEKLYEVTRDKDGKIEYKTNKEGKLIPAINNATYVLPIEMAKELVEKRNKSDLIASPYVRKANHTLDWVTNLESKMRAVNPSIEFDKKNTKHWSDFIRKNYTENLSRREKE